MRLTRRGRVFVATVGILIYGAVVLFIPGPTLGLFLGIVSLPFAAAALVAWAVDEW